MSAMTRYLDALEAILKTVRDTQADAMTLAAQKLAEATISGHNLFAFGCNHAGLLAFEMYYRTGGMVNVNPVRAPGLHLDIDPATMTSQMERLPEYGRVVIDHTPIEKGDVLLIHSVSGRNTVPVDAAIRAHEKGAYVIALTNLNTSRVVTSRHPSGKNLYQVADLVIDDCGAMGDAQLQMDGLQPKIGPTSTAIGAAIVNAVMVEAVEMITAGGHQAPVFISANVDGGDEHNRAVLDAYQSHIFYM